MAQVPSIVRLLNASFFGAIFRKYRQYCVRSPYISDAKTDPFIPFGADLFVYLKHIGIQIIEKNNWYCKLYFTFGQSTGLKRPVCEPSPLGQSGCLPLSQGNIQDPIYKIQFLYLKIHEEYHKCSKQCLLLLHL